MTYLYVQDLLMYMVNMVYCVTFLLWGIGISS